MDNLERNNQSRHVLFTRLLGQKTIQEPDGWANDIPSFKRDNKSRAILSKTEIDLVFYGDGADWLETVFKSFGVSEKVLLLKYEKDVLSINEKWKLRYSQQIDMGSYEKDDDTGAVKVKATEGGLFDEIKNRESDKYNLIEINSADNIDIGELATYPFQPTPRNIYLNTLLRDSQVDYRINSERYKTSYSNTVRTVPLLAVYNPNDAVTVPFNTAPTVNSFIPHDQDEQGPQNGNYPYIDNGSTEDIGNLFIHRSVLDSREVILNFSLKFKVSGVNAKLTDGQKLFVELRKSSLSGGDDILQEITEWLYIDNLFSHINELYTVNKSVKVNLLKDESLGIVFHTQADLGGSGFQGDGHMDVFLNVIESKLVIEDSTDYPISKSKCIKPFDLFDRIIAKITGQTGIFRSSIFGAGGEYEHLVVDNGFWARRFPDSVEEDDGEIREIQFNTSFKEAYEAYNYLEPLCWFEQVDGNTSVIRIEKATYTMKNFVGVPIGSVDKVDEKGQKKEFFSKITIGTKKSLEYEEFNGLDEPNGKSEFTTHIKYASNEYNIESGYRFDSVGYELTRRKSYELAPKEDTPRDSHIFMHDAKYVNGTYFHNLWNDTSRVKPYLFDSAPTGIFSPGTAWNLRLTPMNRLFYGHGYSVNRGLYHFPIKYVRFNSSNANKNLKTVYNGKELQEGGSFQVSELEKPRIEPIQYEATFKMTQAIENAVRGTTKVNGEDVPNYFGLIEFLNNGEKVYGRLVKLEADEEGKLTIISAKL